VEKKDRKMGEERRENCLIPDDVLSKLTQALIKKFTTYYGKYIYYIIEIK
jgi:hypothetical protein